MVPNDEAISPVNYGEVRGPYVENVRCPKCGQLNSKWVDRCNGCGQMLAVNA